MKIKRLNIPSKVDFLIHELELNQSSREDLSMGTSPLSNQVVLSLISLSEPDVYALSRAYGDIELSDDRIFLIILAFLFDIIYFLFYICGY